VKRTKVSLRY